MKSNIKTNLCDDISDDLFVCAVHYEGLCNFTVLHNNKYSFIHYILIEYFRIQKMSEHYLRMISHFVNYGLVREHLLESTLNFAGFSRQVMWCLRTKISSKIEILAPGHMMNIKKR